MVFERVHTTFMKDGKVKPWAMWAIGGIIFLYL